MIRPLLTAFALGLVMLAHAAAAEQSVREGAARHAVHSVDDLFAALTEGALTLTDGNGRALGTLQHGAGAPVVVSEPDVVAALAGARLTVAQSLVLWEFFADQGHVAMATLPVIAALVEASRTPEAREAMWSELAGLARARAETRAADRRPSLLELFERHRGELRARLGDLDESQSATDDVIELMRRSRVFGGDLDESVAYVSYRAPAAVARHIERERGLGHPVRWEYAAFASMLRWKAERMVPGGARAPRTLAELDADGRAFIAVFNCLHGLDEGYREVILRGLGPAELFNAVVAGEKELYRLGTTGYRRFLHQVILRGIRQAGSFEAFLDRVTPPKLGEAAARKIRHRGIVFLRIAAAFGLLETVLETMHDRAGFIDEAIASLDDQRAFEDHSAIVMDVLLARSSAVAVRDFKLDLLDHLYDRYYGETVAAQRAVYGSLLSVYQTMTDGRRDATIDRDFSVDDAAFHLPLERLFDGGGGGGLVHRMLMRLDRNEDDAALYEQFRGQMRKRGATVAEGDGFAVFRLAGAGRAIEIYVNEPSTKGLRRGLAGIADALGRERVHTVIGRGHTSIIAPLQTDAKLVLGERLKDVAAVIVGACGGDASVRELIRTFGYIPLVTTASTGRQVINDAIVSRYIDALMALAPGERLSIGGVVDEAVARYRRAGVDEALRSDAGFYQSNLATVLLARLFDTRVRPLLSAERTAARE